MTIDIHNDHDHQHCEDTEGLTKNEHLVYHALGEANGPLKAYDLLDKLKERGVRAPMTVYRALEGLEAKGVVHKLDAINSFVLCTHSHPHKVQTFLMCTKCESVTEIGERMDETPKVEADILAVVEKTGFRMNEARLEIKGLCTSCS